MSDAKVAVGIDVGSSQARVAVCANDSPRVVSNTLGHRSTLALTALENGDSYVFGDAALRLLQKEKKPMPTVRDILISDNEEESAACEAFLRFQASLASDAMATTLGQLRVILSVPVDASSEYVDSLKGVTEAGIKSAIEDKKQRKHHFVVGVITDPAAVCIAHRLTDSSSALRSNILVIDAGASGLSISHLSSNGTSRIFSLVSHRRLEEVSGQALVALLAKHVASQFERKNRIPTGDVWDSKKTRFKLLQACEPALQSLKTSTIHITIDGLYEGMDCHVEISKPRWEMVSGPLLRQAQAFLQEFESLQPDTVLLAGSGASFVGPSVDKTFPDCYRGISNIAPEEAVALGSARHAASCLEHDIVKLTTPTQDEVVLSPVAIGIGTSEHDLETIIGKGTPLPAHVVHTMDSPASCSIWQLLPCPKRVADLDDLPNDKNVEVLVELSVKGTLSIAVQGGPVVTV
jgi:molecular chaperone DnaK (HSP70)